METEKVLVAMSGGVDSSVAAKLLTDAGFSCIGCTMKLYDNEDAGIPKANTCCSLDDVEDARSVAYRLGMPYYVFNLKDKFAECVIDRFVDAYEHGITPNPCIDCNRYLKFDKLFERADIMGCRYIATGHYARIEREGEKYVLKKALDETKDQSYVLYDLTQETLARVKFPLGSLRKTEAREIAAEAVLTVGRKALECNAVVVCVVNLPRCKAESAAAVKCPCALIFRSVIFDTLECEFCIADSVCPSADNKTLIAVVGIFVCLRIVKAEHNIRQIAVLVRHLY